jgi:hypothetical protein
MKRRAVLFVRLLLSVLITAALAFLPSVALALPPETPVACKEGLIREPILLKYGEHTDGCQLDYVTDVDQFSVYGKAGDEVMLAVGWTTDSYGRTLLITVLGPTGSQIFQESTAMSNGAGQYWRKSISLTETGAHLIFIEEKEHNATPGYQLAIEGIPPMVSTPRLTNGAPEKAAMEGPADIDLFTFQGSAGSLIHIPVSFASDSYWKKMHVQILDSKGVTLADQNSVTSNGYGQNMLIKLPITKSGRYYLTVDGAGTKFDYEVVLQCIFGTCQNLQPQPAVEGCLREKGQPLVGVKVKLEQAGEPDRFKITDTRGCYSFPAVVADLEYCVSVTDTVE